MDNIFNDLPITQNIDFLTILFNIALSFALAIIIAWIYQKTHKGLSYSQSFVVSLVVLCVLSSMIMMVIGNVLIRAVALLGAFTIIRFRTAVKDTKDITFILFSLIVGMAVGTGNYLIGMMGALAVCVIIYSLDKVDFGSSKKSDYILMLSLDKNKSSDLYESVLKRYSRKYTILNIGTESDECVSVTLSMVLARGANAGQLIKELDSIDGVRKVNLVMAKNDIEY